MMSIRAFLTIAPERYSWDQITINGRVERRDWHEHDSDRESLRGIIA